MSEHRTTIWVAAISAIATIAAAVIAGIFALHQPSNSAAEISCQGVSCSDTGQAAPTSVPVLDSTSPAAQDALPPTTDAAPPAAATSTSPQAPIEVSPAQPVQVNEPLSELCENPNSVDYFCGPNDGGTVDVGSQVFTYHLTTNPAAAPDWQTDLQYTTPPCSKIVINFAVNYPGAGTTSARIIQTGSAAVVASAEYGQIGTLTAALNGGPFSLQFSDSTTTALYADGYAVCDSN